MRLGAPENPAALLEALRSTFHQAVYVSYAPKSLHTDCFVRSHTNPKGIAATDVSLYGEWTREGDCKKREGKSQYIIVGVTCTIGEE